MAQTGESGNDSDIMRVWPTQEDTSRHPGARIPVAWVGRCVYEGGTGGE